MPIKYDTYLRGPQPTPGIISTDEKMLVVKLPPLKPNSERPKLDTIDEKTEVVKESLEKDEPIDVSLIKIEMILKPKRSKKMKI